MGKTHEAKNYCLLKKKKEALISSNGPPLLKILSVQVLTRTLMLIKVPKTLKT